MATGDELDELSLVVDWRYAYEHARSQRQGTHEAAVTAAVVACKTERSSTLFHTSGAETAPTGSTGLSFFCCAWIGV